MRQVGGDTVDVVTLVPPGEEAHEYDPTPKQLTAAGRGRHRLLSRPGLPAERREGTRVAAVQREEGRPARRAHPAAGHRRNCRAPTAKPRARRSTTATTRTCGCRPRTCVTMADTVGGAARLDGRRHGDYDATLDRARRRVHYRARRVPQPATSSARIERSGTSPTPTTSPPSPSPACRRRRSRRPRRSRPSPRSPATTRSPPSSSRRTCPKTSPRRWPTRSVPAPAVLDTIESLSADQLAGGRRLRVADARRTSPRCAPGSAARDRTHHGPSSRCATSACTTASAMRCTTCRSQWAPANSSPSSAPTAPARAPCSRPSAGW